MEMEAYRHNLIVAGSLTPFLGVVEVSLRNAVNRQLIDHYGRPDWWALWDGDPLFMRQAAQVSAAKAKLRSRREPDTPDKIVAELTFGFWVILFNAEFQAQLWKPLRRAFRNLPKSQRQRHNVSPLLNRLRILRNRAFHHEPVLWLSPVGLPRLYNDGLTMLAWIDEALPQWCRSHCQFQSVWSMWKCTTKRLRQMAQLRRSQNENFLGVASPNAMVERVGLPT